MLAAAAEAGTNTRRIGSEPDANFGRRNAQLLEREKRLVDARSNAVSGGFRHVHTEKHVRQLHSMLEVVQYAIGGYRFADSISPRINRRITSCAGGFFPSLAM